MSHGVFMKFFKKIIWEPYFFFSPHFLLLFFYFNGKNPFLDISNGNGLRQLILKNNIIVIYSYCDYFYIIYSSCKTWKKEVSFVTKVWDILPIIES